MPGCRHQAPRGIPPSGRSRLGQDRAATVALGSPKDQSGETLRRPTKHGNTRHMSGRCDRDLRDLLLGAPQQVATASPS